MSLVGNLQDLSLPDILQIIALSRKSGILFLQRPAEARARIVFVDGRIVSAWDEASAATFDEILAAQAIVLPGLYSRLQKDTVDPITEVRAVTASLTLKPDRTHHLLEDMTRRVLVRLFRWDMGSFQFELREAGDTPGSGLEPLTLVPGGLDAIDVGMEDARSKDDEARAQAAGFTAPTTGTEALEEEPQSVSAPDPVFVPESTAPPPPQPLAEELPRDTLFDLAEELREEFETSREAVSEPLSPGLGLLKGMLQELNMPNVHTYITLLVLRYVSALMNRALLIEAKGDTFVALGEFGVASTKEESASLVRRIHIPTEEASILNVVAEHRVALKTALNMDVEWNRYLVDLLGGQVPYEVFVGPILCGERLVALVYGDNIPEDRAIGDTEALEIFLSQAGLAIERRLLEGIPTG